MLRWDDVYKVVVAIAPLYVALMLGYGSVKWWRIFTKEQCDGISRLVFYITLPMFTVKFTANIDPFHMNYPFIGADAVSKLIIVVVLAFWANCSSKGSLCWSITSFSLTTWSSTLVVGVPLMKAMYGPMAVNLVVQSAVVQAIIWGTILRSRPSFWVFMKVVGMKFATNPNSYACIVGLAWAFVANRWHFKMPSIIEGCILIMSSAGIGTTMFSMGIFIALQEKVIACGTSLTVFGMVLKFIAGPVAMAIGSLAVGLHDDVLHVAIILAALPPSITSFVLAEEFGLHAEVLSTTIIIGTIVSLPVMIAFYAILELIH
ncbi:hypothetical protein SLA2020_108120 [Shorea laevis]